MKYTSDYQERFASVNGARIWMEGFTTYYNCEHRHSGIGYHNPASVHYGKAEAVGDQRQVTSDSAYRTHPSGLPAARRSPRCR